MGLGFCDVWLGGNGVRRGIFAAWYGVEYSLERCRAVVVLLRTEWCWPKKNAADVNRPRPKLCLWAARTIVAGYAVHPKGMPGSGSDLVAAQRKTLTRFNLARRIHQLIVGAVLCGRAEAAFGLADTAG